MKRIVKGDMIYCHTDLYFEDNPNEQWLIAGKWYKVIWDGPMRDIGDEWSGKDAFMINDCMGLPHYFLQDDCGEWFKEPDYPLQSKSIPTHLMI